MGDEGLWAQVIRHRYYGRRRVWDMATLSLPRTLLIWHDILTCKDFISSGIHVRLGKDD